MEKRERPHRRVRQPGDELQRPRQHARDTLRVEKGDPLGHELSENHRCDGDPGHDDPQRCRVGVRPDPRDSGEALLQALRHGRSADHPGQNPDDGDPDLDGGEEVAGLVRERQRRTRTGPSLVDPLLQAAFARRDHRHLGHGEHAVEEDQREQNQQVHEVRGAGW